MSYSDAPRDPTVVDEKVHRTGSTTIIDRKHHMVGSGEPGEFASFGIPEMSLGR